MFSGAAWSAVLTVLAPLIEMFLKAIGSSVNDYFDRQLDAQNARELGGLDMANKINTKTLDMQDAIDSVPRASDDAVADSLRTGKF